MFERLALVIVLALAAAACGDDAAPGPAPAAPDATPSVPARGTPAPAPGSDAAPRENEFAARHLLVAYAGALKSEATRTKEEARARAEEALAELQKPGATFADVAPRYTDDATSAPQGGFLGVFVRGQMVPQFQDALDELQPGETSGIVELPFGFHVIQRVSLEEARALAVANTAIVHVAVFPYEGAADARPGMPTKEKALESANWAAELVRSGTAFDALPPELGAVPLAPGWQSVTISRGTVRPEFAALETAAFSSEPGQTADPVESAVGFLVVKRLPYFRTRVQHLVVMHKNSERVPEGITRTKEEAKARAEEAYAKLQADPNSWAQVVGEYSDEPGAGARQGDLGRVEPGNMVPEFDEAIAATPPGGMSGVVESRFGYHVLRRLD